MATTNKQSIEQALRARKIRTALNQLVGCPVGGWGETDQAWRYLGDVVPWKTERDYTVAQLVDYALDGRGAFYTWRNEEG